eukprot:Trichotokara_eunicae@DN6579_c0_g1_i1.p1
MAENRNWEEDKYIWGSSASLLLAGVEDISLRTLSVVTDKFPSGSLILHHQPEDLTSFHQTSYEIRPYASTLQRTGLMTTGLTIQNQEPPSKIRFLQTKMSTAVPTKNEHASFQFGQTQLSSKDDASQMTPSVSGGSYESSTQGRIRGIMRGVGDR